MLGWFLLWIGHRFRRSSNLWPWICFSPITYLEDALYSQINTATLRHHVRFTKVDESLQTEKGEWGV
ncbi:MAG TPA: hypothetical protein DCY91_17275, partial [Cyanobacteria bacterium UBA11370]|nr:hypothetical protein [Cyanobacteria bacterium UBA11370]